MAAPTQPPKGIPKTVPKAAPAAASENRTGAVSTALSGGVDLAHPRGTKRRFEEDGDGGSDRGGRVAGSSDERAAKTTDNGSGAVKPEPRSKSEDAGTVHAIVVPKHKIIRFLNGNFQATLTILATQSKRFRKIPPEEGNEENKRRYKDARAYLDWMATSLEITPQIRDQTKVRKVLEIVCKNPEIYLPADIKHKAAALLDKWEAENWGADEIIEVKGEEDEEEGDDSEDEGQAQSSARSDATEVAIPSEDDPTFGKNGMMYGILVGRGAKGRRTYFLNPRVPHASARVFGHNGLTVGDWFPLQIVALFRGAHGSRMGGIYGSALEGAYSIVTSIIYEDLDEDHGDVLFYSGSDSHENTNPDTPATSTAGTKALKISQATGRPVRVLRSGGSYNSKKTNKFAPSCGIRYDGLYRVVERRLPKNKKGGLYEQFRLVRCSGQRPLESYRKSVPNYQQVEALSNLQSRF